MAGEGIEKGPCSRCARTTEPYKLSVVSQSPTVAKMAGEGKHQDGTGIGFPLSPKYMLSTGGTTKGIFISLLQNIGNNVAPVQTGATTTAFTSAKDFKYDKKQKVESHGGQARSKTSPSETVKMSPP
ncbi:hypothetical protein SARC_05029 [Sphaeroforma arctica JP610]|uniref:Uncharacterized protein n=1 Tax=Sphaeroforma arctica JP610 TaxID=667725 RepID=A0A0L0G0U9_9EUKA|nr:hypothetical protein SARC_05029 [Sphaeroforma arctica JP610]KNC82690.1 hypothetical protein SARC_05029 [Sphaeroforma arctica JP610]|eukprot:XP_014156592.1 hypothetical protein SARC_05029 [Sphaeroforma arctica JP610]